MRFHRFSAILSVTFGACSVLAALCVLPQPLLAATITVNGQTGDPPGTSCDLVEAMLNALHGSNNTDCAAGQAGPNTIELTVDVTLDAVNNTDAGPNGLPVVTASTVEIQGNGFTIRRDGGADDFRIFGVQFGTLTLRNTTVSGGQISGAPGSGGGIRVVQGELTLANTTVSGNSAISGGGIFSSGGSNLTIADSMVSANDAASNGGGIVNGSGTLTITGSTLAGNTATGSGGGINSFGVTATVDISDSTLRGNSTSGNGGGISIGSGTAYIRRSTFAGNSANSGGGVHSGVDGDVDLRNATLSGNSAGGGGGIYNQGTADVINSTLAGNSATNGGGIDVAEGATSHLWHTLLANSAGGNCRGGIIDFGANLADDDTCPTIPDTLSGLDPILSDNGGATMTHALLPGSNAIDAGLAPAPGPGTCLFATDQRGAAREGLCDIGAFEFLTCPDLPFTGETVTGSRTVWNCQNLVADFAVEGAGELTLRAGRSIEIHNNTTVASGGSLSLVIDGGLQVAKIAFATSSTHSGDLVTEANTLTSNTGCGGSACTDGLEAGDAICQYHADSNPGDPFFTGRAFKAWLSDASCSPAQGCRSFTQSMAQYYRVDGVRVADDWADLTDGSLQVPINLDEQGNTAGLFAWTNTLPDGNRSSDTFHCSGWTNDTGAQQGVYGFTPAATSIWTDALDETPCDAPGGFVLYCFEQ